MRGMFNICYWVHVEGLSELWVVRFPLIGMVPMDMMTAKFSSEVATLKFLSEKTLVRVPKLIGYGLGDDDIPIPFMITQNIQGLPLSIYWGRFAEYEQAIKRILNSLAQQYLELLSHPFERIGSLRLTPDGIGWEIGTSPISVDQFDVSRDGLKITLSKPHSSSLDYYASQARLFERSINEQRNSVCDEQDAISKYITSEVFRRVIPHFINRRFEKGPFFLFHLDLHANNVITNRNWEVEAILDWEFTSALPMEVAFSPPRCIMQGYREDMMHFDSENYKSYASRLQIFITSIENHLASSYPNLSEVRQDILAQLHDALLKRRAFFAWSASDIRCMFSLLWEHLVLATPVAISRKGDDTSTENIIFDSKQELIAAMLEMTNDKEVKDWVTERLLALHEHELERDRHEKGYDRDDGRSVCSAVRTTSEKVNKDR